MKAFKPFLGMAIIAALYFSPLIIAALVHYGTLRGIPMSERYDQQHFVPASQQ